MSCKYGGFRVRLVGGMPLAMTDIVVLRSIEEVLGWVRTIGHLDSPEVTLAEIRGQLEAEQPCGIPGEHTADDLVFYCIAPLREPLLN